MSFLQLVLLLDKTIEGINSILPIVSYRNKNQIHQMLIMLTNIQMINTLKTVPETLLVQVLVSHLLSQLNLQTN